MLDVDLSRPILVVDDDPIVREVITTVLLCGGYSLDRVETAKDGREALSRVAKRQHALVLLDVQMPGLDGPGFLREARARGFDAPVLLVTSEPNRRQIARDCGAEGFIAKPFRPAHLLAAVARFCPHAARAEAKPVTVLGDGGGAESLDDREEVVEVEGLRQVRHCVDFVR